MIEKINDVTNNNKFLNNENDILKSSEEMANTVGNNESSEDEDPSINISSNDKTPLIKKSSSSSLTRWATSGNNPNDTDESLKRRCPTCQGKGKLSQSQADTLVALIPVTDKRLKPRRTKCYLAITLLISVTTVFFVAFFLLPRSINIRIVKLNATKIFMPTLSDKKSVPYIDLEVTYTVSNDNYFSSSLEEIGADISWNKFIINTTLNAKSYHIGPRKKSNYTVKVQQVFSGEAVMGKVKLICGSGWSWQLLEQFQTTARFSSFGRTEEVTDKYYGYVLCYTAKLNY